MLCFLSVSPRPGIVLHSIFVEGPVSTKDIPPNCGKLKPLGCHLPRGVAISVWHRSTARTERKMNAEPPHLATMPARLQRLQLMIGSN